MAGRPAGGCADGKPTSGSRTTTAWRCACRSRRLIALCNQCHGSSHFGLAQVQGRADEALAHLMAVTGASQSLAESRIEEAFALWEARLALTWHLDLSRPDGGRDRAGPPGVPGMLGAEIAAERLAAERRARVMTEARPVGRPGSGEQKESATFFSGPLGNATADSVVARLKRDAVHGRVHRPGLRLAALR